MTHQPPASGERVATYLERTGAPRGVQLHELPGDASTRRYVRVTAPSGHSQMLLVHPEPIDADSLPFLNVARLLDRMGVRVPRVIRCEADLGIVELQDLGDLTLQQCLVTTPAHKRADRYLEAVEIIATIQDRGRELSSAKYVPFGLAFDVDKLMWELDFFVDHFLIAARGASPSPDQRSELRHALLPLASTLAAEPRVLCHRDYHSRNLMVHDDHLYVIDFQDARLGPDTYDLVSLLRDSYVDNPSALIEQMIDEYLRLTRRGDDADFRRRFDVMSVQRHLKALGTFGYQSTVADTSRYEDDIPRTLRYLSSVFDRQAQFDPLRALLSSYVSELR